MKTTSSRCLPMAVPVLAAILTLLPPAAHPQAAIQAWVQRYNGPGSFDNLASALALDIDGNVYVTGCSYNEAAWRDGDYVTIKYSSAGVPLWTNRYKGPGTNNDQPTAMAVDRSGNVYVTGKSSGITVSVYLTVAYSGAGVPLWTNRYKRPADQWAEARAMAIDANGHVAVTGESMDSGGSTDSVTIKYSSAGVPLWTNVYDGGSGRDMAVDTNGNLFVTGPYYNGVNNDYATIKYSSAGVALWTNKYNGPGNLDDVPVAIEVDSSGNVIVTGTSSDPPGPFGNPDYATIKYSSAGLPLWTNRYDGGLDGDAYDAAVALAVDASGNVIVTGTSEAENHDYATVKYSSAGVPLWTNRYNGPANYTDLASAVAVDAQGNVYVTGKSTSHPNTPSGYDYGTITYSTTGVPSCTNRYNGPTDDVDGATAIAVDANGNVYVTGYSVGDFATVKYAPVTPPALRISVFGSQLRLAWPSSATGWALRRASLVAGPYTDPGLSVTTEANESAAYDNFAATAAFYRLERQP